MAYFCFMKKLMEIDESTLDKSPFRCGLEIKCSRSYVSDRYRSVGGVLVNDSYLYDLQSRTSLYHSKLNDEVLMMLSLPALRLFIHIANRMESGKDWVRVNREYFMKLSGVRSVNTFKGAVRELVRYCIISPSHYDLVFWVNPSFMFSGDRVRAFRGNVVVVSERSV